MAKEGTPPDFFEWKCGVIGVKITQNSFELKWVVWTTLGGSFAGIKRLSGHYHGVLSSAVIPQIPTGRAGGEASQRRCLRILRTLVDKYRIL